MWSSFCDTNRKRLNGTEEFNVTWDVNLNNLIWLAYKYSEWHSYFVCWFVAYLSCSNVPVQSVHSNLSGFFAWLFNMHVLKWHCLLSGCDTSYFFGESHDERIVSCFNWNIFCTAHISTAAVVVAVHVQKPKARKALRWHENEHKYLQSIFTAINKSNVDTKTMSIVE